MICDDSFVCVGSANLVDISMDLAPDLHSEICVGIEDSGFAALYRRLLFKEHFDVDPNPASDFFDEFVCEISKPTSRLYRMSPTLWGLHILPIAVDIFERARK